jgi:hypothetical protein
MKQSCVILLVAVSFSLLQMVSGQAFVNLDFEEANVPPTPVDTLGSFVDPALAFPGWTVLPNGSAYGTSVFYNDLSLGGPAIVLMGPDFPNGPGYDPLDGSYSVLLQYFGIGNPPALSQTALIPAGTQSISILGNAVITLNGVNIPLIYNLDGASAGDISAFAGQTAQLTITTINTATINSHTWDYFDDVQFSPESVPEPTVCSLMIVCILVLGSRMTRPNNSPESPPIALSVPPSRLTRFAAWFSFCR